MISIVIPTLNEAEMIGRCVDQFGAHAASHEVVVVDGGSQDDTVAIVGRRPGVKLLRASPKGRGRQMNCGALAADGQTLLFLHADTYLPPGGLRLIEQAMGPADVIAGSFSLSFDHPNPMLRLFGLCSRLNHRLLTYGDQGLFMARNTFLQMGGFADMPLMEDVEILKRLRRMGRFVKLDQAVVTSPRRFLTHGIIRQQILNAWLVMLYHAGVSPTRLKRYYP